MWCEQVKKHPHYNVISANVHAGLLNVYGVVRDRGFEPLTPSVSRKVKTALFLRN